MRIKCKKFVFIGGDERMVHAADFIAEQGIETALFACGDKTEDIKCIDNADCVVLPTPALKGIYLNTPRSTREFKLQDVMNHLCGKTIFAPTLPEDIGCEYIDYSKRQEFITANAKLTAQGAVACILKNVKKPLPAMRILLLGFGNVARACGEVLSRMGCDVTVAVRRNSAANEANWCGFKTHSLQRVWDEANRFDIVINTIPARILSEERLMSLKDDCYLLELASSPGGFEKNCAENLGIKYEIAGGIPGKTSPKAAGQIIAETVLNIIAEMSDER